MDTNPNPINSFTCLFDEGNQRDCNNEYNKNASMKKHAMKEHEFSFVTKGDSLCPIIRQHMSNDQCCLEDPPKTYANTFSKSFQTVHKAKGSDSGLRDVNDRSTYKVKQAETLFTKKFYPTITSSLSMQNKCPTVQRGRKTRTRGRRRVDWPRQWSQQPPWEDVKYLVEVRIHKREYQALKPKERKKRLSIAWGIFNWGTNTNGRFLKLDSGGQCQQLSIREALHKIKDALRDRKHMRKGG